MYEVYWDNILNNLSDINVIYDNFLKTVVKIIDKQSPKKFISKKAYKYPKHIRKHLKKER
jgi:hypothetical protein